MLSGAIVTLGVLGCGGPEADWSHFAVASPAVRTVAIDFPAVPQARLSYVTTIGSESGDVVFGFIGGAAFAADGSIFVTDKHERRVGHYTRDGTLIRHFGRKGAGPGEFLAPSHVSVFGDHVYVLDEALGRIIAFDSTGRYQRSVAAPESEMISDISSLQSHSLAMTLSLEAGSPLQWVDSTGARTDAGLDDFPRTQAFLPQTAHPGGKLCRTDLGGIIYANPWLYELVEFDATGNMLRTSRIHSQLRAPQWVGTAQDGPRAAASGLRQRTGLMGLACGSAGIVVAYLDLEGRRIFYDILGDEGDPRAHLAFDLVDDLGQPGFLVDMMGDMILTYRGRPYPHVSLFRIETVE